MKILHTISGLNIYSGGPSFSVYLLVKELRAQGIDVEILCFDTEDSTDRLISKDNFINTIKPPTFRNFGYSINFLKFFKENPSFDIYHGNGLWQMPVHFMAKEARKKNKLYIITLHGMLRPWALEQSKIKKKIALLLYQNMDIKSASCLHATSKLEAYEIRRLGINNPIAIIPNGINIVDYPVRIDSIPKSEKTILYLSRIFSHKGLEFLIEAWSLIQKSNRRDWRLVIAGNGDSKYINQLNHLISKKKLEGEIIFEGPKYGLDKIITYQQADLFVLPTLGENFGMVVAEALASGLPVITTKGAPWEELIIHKAGWWIDIGVEPLVRALIEAMSLSDDERKQMGLNGRKLVEENYSIESVAQKMIRLYEWILYKKEMPEFVFIK
ncbi:MAG: glycosyltransferase [Ignavibacterium album]|uniref:glycosyltransferase n=1 Tax=Ignavibacterium album TaxID=591197 RepID=UPI0026F081E2|nr:glycosyltransferase [Ignavibacterium album]MBI5663322.1 glycosyltransferase [Ignavibacterium album]